MIRELPHHINLGLRPINKFEVVDKQTGRTTYLPADPGGLPIQLLVNPQDLAFASRPKEFLTELRNQRMELLKEVRREKKRKPYDATKTPTKRPRRQSKSTLQLFNQLDSKLDAATSEALKRLLG